MKTRTMWFKRAAMLLAMAACALVGEAGGETVFRGAHHWLSRNEWKQDDDSGVTIKPKTSNSISGGARVFDLTISMYKERTEEERAYISEALTNFAYAVYEATDGAHKIGKIKIYEDGRSGCDVKWTYRGHPNASLASKSGNGEIRMFDVFENGYGTSDMDFLSSAKDRMGAGFTLAHEWGHAVYAFGDEYVIAETKKPQGLGAQVAVVPSIMNSQWNAIGSGGSIDPRWLNYSIAHDAQAADQSYRNTEKTAQHLYHSQSCWEQLHAPHNKGFGLSEGFWHNHNWRGYTQSYPEFTRPGKNVTQPPSIEINTTQGKSRAVSELEIEWPGKSALMWGICIDRSGSMSSSDMANVRQRASHLVDIAPVGTLISVNVFNASISTIFPFTEVTPENRASLKSQIASIPSSSGNTALWDAAYRMLGDIDAIDTTHKNVASIVLLTDGQDNVSSHTKAQIVSRCKLMGVSFNSIAYGSYADSNLQSASEETGGSYNRSSQSMLGLEAAFSRTITYVSSRVALADYQYTMPDGGALTNKFYIDSNLTNIHVSVGYSSSSGATAIILDPNSVQIMPSTTNYLGSEVSFGFDVSQYNVGEYKVLMSAGAGTKATLYADADMLQGGPSVSGMVSERDGCAYVTVSDLYSIDDATVCAMLPTANGQYRKVPFEGGGCGMYRLPLRDCGNNFVVEINAIANVAKKIYDDGMVSPIEKSGSESISQSFTRILTLAMSVSYTNQYQNANATWRYGVADGECIIASGEVYVPAVACCKKTAIVPSEIDGKAVVSLGDYAFYGNNAVNIIVPASVKNIGYETFAGCTNLVRVAFLGKPPAISDWESFKDSMIGMTILYNLEYSNEWDSFVSMFDGLSVTFEGYSRLNNGTWIVDGVHGDDNSVGISASYPLASISAAIDIASDGDKIVVADGIYEPFICTNRNIIIESVNGPRYAIIDGGGTNRCATLGTSAGHTNTVLRGFTLRNGNASGSAVKLSRNYGGGASFGTVDNCYVYGNKASCGSGISNARLLNSIVSGNEVNRGVVYFDRMPFRNVVKGCIFARNKGDFASAIYIQDNNGKGVDIENCLFYENRVVAHWTVFDQLLDKSCNVRNSTVVNNQSGYGLAGIGYMSVDNSIVWNNRNHNGVVVNDRGTSSYLNSCMESLQAGNGNITNNPQFVDAEHHVYLLKANSPCIGMSSTGQHIGMCDVAEDEGFVVGTEVDGYGLILEPGTVVEAGRNVTFTAAEIGREFLHFKTNGVFATTNYIIEINNIQSDILVTAVFAKQQFFIDSINGSDINNGVSWRLAKQTIDSAIHDALDYDVITVTNGIYSSITPGEKKIKIMSVNGADYTIIDGNNKNRCVTCLEGGNGVTNSIVDGFTLRNGFSSSSGGGAIGGILRNCHIVDCEATTYGGGACDSRLENCVVARNKAGTYGGGTYYGYADHCTICGNEAGASSGGSYYGTFYNSIVSKNFVGGNEANWMYGTFDSCCTYPNRGKNPIDGDPMLVDGYNGDARLRVGSPCIEDGVQVCGAYVGEPLEGVSVSVGICGAGTVSNETVLVTSGDNATIEAVETVRPFLYWVINGEQITNRIYTITNLISDIRITAVFGTFDWYVDAEYGDDANDGSDWNVAKQTLQAAVAAAVDNENIYVESGTYGPISSDNKRIRIESMNGAELTFIDGGGTNRCAMLGQSGIPYATNTVMSGFSIVNGFNASDGGAVCGGTLEDCILSDNTTYRNGGATYYSNLERCVLTRNTARFTGGGAYNGTLRNCLVFGNTSGNAGGGVSSVRAYNSTIARNKTEKLLSSSNCGSGGSYQGSCYNTIVWDNRDAYGNVSNYNGTAFYYSCTLPQKGTGCVTNDPQFIDAGAGDFHLMVGSPCIDAGLNNYVHEDFDLEWDDRIQGVKVDVGCFEGAEYATPPGQVSGLCAVRGVLTWDEMPEAEGFMIYRSTRKAPASAKYIGFSDANTYIDETAVDGTTYYYWVMAFNTLGMGMRSEAAENIWPVLLSITTSELPDATEMVEYRAQLEAIGGTPPYSWSCPARGYTVTTNSTSTFAEVGTAQGWHADDNCWTLELPFDFPFYGNKYRTVYVNSNGTLTFDGDFDRWSYSVQNFTNRVMIAALWSDLDTSYGGDVYVSTNSDVVTICWVCQYHSGGGSVAASAKLYSNGDICLAYGNGNANGGFVGVSAGDGLRYIPLGSEMSLNAAQDILLRSGGIADGLFISEEGQITGIPTTAGVNTFTVTVTDAVGDVEEKELSIVVNENPNHKPEIDNVSPVTNVYVKVGDSATFAVTAHDPEGAILEYSWYLDGEEIEYAANSYTFTATLEDAGAHTLECVVSDGLWTDMVRHRWSFRVVRDWYVDASAEDDSGDGSSVDSVLYSISEALWYAEDGDTIYVAPGLYDDYLEFDSGRTVSIIATGGTSCTFFTGGVDGYDTEWFLGEAVVQSTMRGFTFRGCYLGGITLADCVLTCDETECYPSEVFGCRLFDCSVTGNVCDYSPIQRCELTRCTVAGNTVGEYGAVGYSSYVYDCIVWDNVTVNGETSNYDTEIWYDEWWDDDAEEYVSEEYAEVHIFNSCTWPMPSGIAGTGNITSDPRLVDAMNGDLRLRVGSPCLVGGVQAMGVYLGDPVAGFVLSVRIEGNGAVSPMTAVVANDGNATFEVADNTRPFIGFSTNGVFATAADTLTWQGVKSDGIITAVFSNFTFYVDAAAGDDANDGLSWATARASIQSAINDAVRGETIYVKAGTYDPIVVGAAMRLRIESVDGKEATVIDGDGERQCANLGGNGSLSSSLIGFTLTNGYSSYGGGAFGGTLIDCNIMNNYAMYLGGGLYYSTAVRCQISDNKAGGTNLWVNVNGGGAYGGSLRNCLLFGNTVESSNYCEGGGTYYSELYNCTVVDNAAYGNGYGGGVVYGDIYNSVVFGNYAEYDEETRGVWMMNSLVGEDPKFSDAENGDYRLAADSQCIDAGSNSYVIDIIDLDGNARIQHYTVDIGCYEYELATPERDTEADFAAQMAGTCYGVFVGVGQYTYTSSLTGPTIDATNMQTRCVAKGYWRDENTVAFLDAAATKSVVRARLATLAAKAVSGDTVLYYQSSHGGSHTSGGNYTKDAYICLHDERYEDYEMAEDLMQFAAGVKVVIILDTCHSAGMFKAMGTSSASSAKSFALRVRDLMAERSILRRSAKSGITADDIGWIAAADFNQYSWDSLSGGAFTVAMLDGWKSGEADYDGDNRLNFHELWRYAKGIATGYYGEDATDAQCLNENVLLSRFAGTPDSTSNGESTETTPAPVEHVWLDSYPAILAAFGGDYEAMANAPSPGVSGNGKTWPNGSPCYVWQDFVAGTSPTNDTVFTATIHMNGNTPVITWEPDTSELRATRVYRTYGKKTLMDASWTDITDKDMSEYHFFKVTVDLP